MLITADYALLSGPGKQGVSVVGTLARDVVELASRSTIGHQMGYLLS